MEIVSKITPNLGLGLGSVKKCAVNSYELQFRYSWFSHEMVFFLSFWLHSSMVCNHILPHKYGVNTVIQESLGLGLLHPLHSASLES